MFKEIVKERGRAYGSPAENHARTSRFWDAYDLNTPTKGEYQPIDVCFLNILQKISRCQSSAGPSRDSIRDIQGYAENILTLMDKEDVETE